MLTVVTITAVDPKSGKTQRAAGVRRGDAYSRLLTIAGEATAEEFLKVVREDPDRLMPWMSKDGATVVVFSERDDSLISWEPKRRTSQKRVKCVVCGKVSNASGMALHQKNAGHEGTEAA
ncbi:hypothetical protein [Sinomonas sp. P10A9]|uniref:C2H2-type domain-containing protein n=1 Tax=Sinomonas puerhi TaxID=3238584 RepID=A0AB39KZ94_9MICC